MLKKTYIAFALHIASFASVIGLVYTIMPKRTGPVFLFLSASAAILFLIALGLEFHAAWTTRTLRYPKQSPKIEKFMSRWVKNAGRVAILSRDLSWMNATSIQTLRVKAQKNELTILIETSTATTDDLKANGARVIEYGDLGHIPKSRFTIVDFERDGARVAIGATDGDSHVIERFQSGKHPLYGVADDLVRFLIGHASK